MTETQQAKCATFKLPELFNIETAEHATSALKAILAQQPLFLNIDISSVECVTTPGFQVLIALEKWLNNKGVKMNICGDNEAFYSCMKDLGLCGIIGQLQE